MRAELPLVAADLSMPRVIAQRAFSYTPDGVRARWVEAGEQLDVPAALLADLILLGNVERADLLIPPGPDSMRRRRTMKSDSDEN